MAHEVYRLKEKLSNTPHLIHPSSFETVIQYLESREFSDFKIKSQDKVDADSNTRYSLNRDVGAAILNIEGPLTYKPVSFMGMDCGGASYQQMKEDFTYLVEQGVKTIAFVASSGGGEAFQMMPTADYMRNLADQHGVKILSYVDGLAASACYGLISVSDEIILAPSAEVGSIGVVVRLMNDSKALEMSGLERTYVYAGDSKIPFDEDGSFRKEFLDDIQYKVDALYEEFTGFVSKHRGLPVEAVRSTQAKTFLPEKALELGLADKVMTLEGFYSYLADVAQGDNQMLKTKLFKTNTASADNEVKMKELMELQAQHSELEAKFQAQGAELVAHVEQIASLSAELEAAKASLEVAQSELTAFAAMKEQMEAEAAAKAEEEKQAKLAAREEKLTALLGEVEGKEVYQAIGELEDAQFAAALKGYELMAEREAASALFSEQGVEGEADLEVKPVSFADFMPKKKQK